jgi:hypothetical protein
VIPQLQRQLPKEGDEEGLTMLSSSVTEKDIAYVVARATGIPVNSLLVGEKERLLEMEKYLSSKVVGQEEAVSAIRLVTYIYMIMSISYISNSILAMQFEYQELDCMHIIDHWDLSSS